MDKKLRETTNVCAETDLVGGGHARASVEPSDEGGSLRHVLRLQSRALSFAYLARFPRPTKKKERLLVVYT